MEDGTLPEKSTAQLLEQIEKMAYFRWMANAASMFKEVRYLADTRGETEIARQAQFEIEINNLTERSPFINTSYTGRFVDFRRDDGSERLSLSDFSREQFSYYESRLHDTTNPFLKSRYADVLFEYFASSFKLNKFELGKILVEVLIETGSLHLAQSERDYLLFLGNIARAADVAIKLNNAEILARVIASLVPVMEDLGGKDLRWIYETSLILRGIRSSPLGSGVPSDMYAAITRRIDEARAFFLKSEDWLTWHRSFCEELVAWGGILRWDGNRAQLYRREIGESYEREAEIKATKDGSIMLKARFLEKALNHYVNIGATDKIGELKVRVQQAHAASREEYQPFSQRLEIPMDEIEKQLSPYKNLSLSDALHLVASDRSLIVDVASVEQQTSKIKESSPFEFALFPFVVDGDRKVFQSDSAESTFGFLADQNYKMAVIITIEALLKEIFRTLVEERGMTQDEVVNFIRSWPLLDERNSIFVEVGIQRFFARDYISALHILVPQFESCLRRMFAQAGYPTTSIGTGGTQQEQTFTAFLEREDVKAVLKPNFHKYIQFVMVDQTGFNLRNDIAHGLIRPEDCTETNALMVIHMFLILNRFRLAPERQEQ
jgi:hypothetical protein